MRQQPEQRRWLIHLLNLDPSLARVRGVGLAVSAGMLPPGGAVKIGYPDDERIINYRRAGGALVFTARDFAVHDMILVEY